MEFPALHSSMCDSGNGNFHYLRHHLFASCIHLSGIHKNTNGRWLTAYDKRWACNLCMVAQVLTGDTQETTEALEKMISHVHQKVLVYQSEGDSSNLYLQLFICLTPQSLHR